MRQFALAVVWIGIVLTLVVWGSVLILVAKLLV
jgi:hypothetical protein